ncbi:hypothetical protein PoB_001083300 [Plakobranchus ocellatus]|uniref:Uncharacterized protein n=1 Tax=Plakobranchus ocellatus TaxID=259542 RepID=A0AAV3YPR2_9GAST|nr:hypothetical protein PoB_001083300 [Plakobranchus ocellatus]
MGRDRKKERGAFGPSVGRARRWRSSNPRQKVPEDLRADSQANVPLTPPGGKEGGKAAKYEKKMRRWDVINKSTVIIPCLHRSTSPIVLNRSNTKARSANTIMKMVWFNASTPSLQSSPDFKATMSDQWSRVRVRNRTRDISIMTRGSE